MSIGAAELCAWLATYALHSTILIGLAALAARALRGQAPRLEERLWRLAVVAGLWTAGLSTGLDLGPRWTWVPGVGAPATAAAAQVEHAAGTDAAGVDTAADRGASTVAAADSIAPDEPRPVRGFGPHPRTLALVWFGGAGFGLALLASRYAALLWRLRGRRALAGEDARGLERLAARAGVAVPRLSTSTRIVAPLSLGLPRPEICLPERACTELDRAGREAMIAHELAHLARRDPARLLWVRALEATFFFQPLLRLARQRLVATTETLCDEWAVSQTGRRLELARTLTEVAGWITRAPRALPVPQMAACRSALGRRVERLLAPPDTEPSNWPWLGFSAVVVVAIAAAGPGVAAVQRPVDVSNRQGPATDLATYPESELGLGSNALAVIDLLDEELGALAHEIQTLLAEAEMKGLDEPATRLLDLDRRLGALRSHLAQAAALACRLSSTNPRTTEGTTE